MGGNLEEARKKIERTQDVAGTWREENFLEAGDPEFHEGTDTVEMFVVDGAADNPIDL